MSMRAARDAVGWRAIQQAGVQFIYFARLLILARLLAPEAFGLLAIAMVAVSVLMSLSDLGIVPALVQRSSPTREEHDAAWTIGLLRSVAVTLLLVAAAPLVAGLFEQPDATPIIQALAFRPFIAALASIGIVQLTRDFRFRELAAIHLPGALVDAIVAVALAPIWGVWALVAGALGGAAASTVLSYVIAPHRPRILVDLATAAPLIRFGRWVLGTSVIGLISTSAVQLVISRRLGVAELGLYFLATKIAFLPADAMRGVVGSVAFPLYASIQEDLRATVRTFRSLLVGQAVVLLPVYAIMIVLAPSLAEALGPRWAGTTPLIRIIALAAAGGIYADAVLPLLLGRGRPDRVMMVVGVQTATLLAVIVPFTVGFGVEGAAATWLPAYGSALVVSIALARHEIGHPFAGAGPVLTGLLAIAALAAATATIGQVLGTGIPALAGGIVLGLLSTGGLLLLLSRVTNLGLDELVRPPAAPLAR